MGDIVNLKPKDDKPPIETIEQLRDGYWYYVRQRKWPNGIVETLSIQPINEED